MATNATNARTGLADTKVRVQQVGRFLSNMVMPNISAFVAWGLITSLFIPTGWTPNEHMAKLVGPMITYLLPLLIGYTGGRLVGGDRGAVVGAISTMGVVVGASIPMFLGAMIIGPIGGYAIREFDRMVEGRVRAGFEMLVANFSAGIIGMLVAILAYLVVGPVVASLSVWLGAGVQALINTGWIPLASLLVEPAKILFLNNTINHGVFTPLGTQEALAHGKSLVFLIEANPGPGLGLLLAYFFFGRGVAKQSSPAAMIIHFLGGIHEIYFPYVLMNPRLILAVILGGMTGVFTLTLFNAGLVSPASPGSIFAVLLMTPKASLIGVALSIIASTLVSFLTASMLLKRVRVGDEESNGLSEATRRMQALKQQSKSGGKTSGEQPLPAPALDLSKDLQHVRKIIVACDAGMGSSALGAGVLRKKVKDAGLTHISVSNCAINSLPDDVDLVITHQDLTERAMRHAPQAMHISLSNFLDSGLYTDLTTRLLAAKMPPAANDNRLINQTIIAANDETFAGTERDENLFKLSADNIFLNLTADNKAQAIRFAGEMLVSGGYVEPDYIDAMLAREALTTTYLGESIAVPHGTVEAKDRVLRTGIVICQYPQGVQFGDEPDDVARLVIGIAARNNEHVQVIARLANALDDKDVIERLTQTSSVQEILQILSGEQAA